MLRALDRPGRARTFGERAVQEELGHGEAFGADGTLILFFSRATPYILCTENHGRNVQGGVLKRMTS